MNALPLVLLLLIIDAKVAAVWGQIRLRGRRTKRDKKLDFDDRTAAATKEESSCQEIDLELTGTKWNLTKFTWNSSQDEGGDETLQPVDLTRERRGMTLEIEEDGTSGTCGNNLCWGVSEKIEVKRLRPSSREAKIQQPRLGPDDKIFWIHDLARTRMMSTPQEEAYAKMLTRSPYSYKTCVDSSTEHTQLHLFEVDIDDDGGPVQGRLMAEYDQIKLNLV
jgi:hypothetical protein